jgi:uncharacterized protein YndB with AHSA1/START domain
MAMTELTTEASITIDAPITSVWEALTTPDLISRWFFGVDTETDWTEGSPIVHRGEYQGRPYEDKGTIVRFEPPRRLVHTHWSPASGLEDRPENYQEVTWRLSEVADGTQLTVSEVNLPSEEAKSVSDESWKTALASLKDLLDKGGSAPKPSSGG